MTDFDGMALRIAANLHYEWFLANLRDSDRTIAPPAAQSDAAPQPQQPKEQ